MRKLAGSLPRSGEGEAELLAGQTLRYTWQREPVELRFDRGRIAVTVKVLGRFQLLGERLFPISVTIIGEPVITPDFKALLQSTEVAVKADGPLDSVNRAVEEKLQGVISGTLQDFRMDVRPLLESAFARLARPIEVPVGDQVACAELRLAALEAGPTVLADGVEKDFAVVVLPSVTLPCTPVASLSSSAPADGGPSLPDAGPVVASSFKLPLLANVASLPTGPFTVTLPVAARYEELSLAFESAIQGKLFFSEDYPELYLEKPHVYPSGDAVVIRMLLGGSARVAGLTIPMDGEIFFAGHPRVIDNQLAVPDLDITPGTAAELVKLKFALDGEAIREQARAAMRVDVSERLAAVKDKLSTELSFAEGEGCVRAEALRSEVTGIFPHETFLRIYVQVDAQASLYMPCKH